MYVSTICIKRYKWPGGSCQAFSHNRHRLPFNYTLSSYCIQTVLSACGSIRLILGRLLNNIQWFTVIYVLIRGLSLFKNFLHSKSAVVSTAYMPFVDIGYYAFGIIGLLYLVEFPFLLWYISTKVMGVDRRGLNRKQCMLNMMKSVGCAGMVLFMQVASWYLVYAFISLLAYHIYISRLKPSCLSLLKPLVFALVASYPNTSATLMSPK